MTEKQISDVEETAVNDAVKAGEPVWIERPDALTRVVTLEFPLVLGADGDAAGKVHRLILRKPKVRDILAAGKVAVTEDERRVQLVASVAGQLPSMIEELYASDWERVNDAFDELRFPLERQAGCGA